MNDQHQGGRGADWFLAHFNLSKEETVGIQYPPKKDEKIQWNQWGCLAACALVMLFMLGICLIVGLTW